MKGKEGASRARVALGLRFAIFLAGIYFVCTYAAVYQRVVAPFTAFTARLAAEAGALLHLSVRAQGVTLVGPGSSVHVGQGCDAIDVVSIILAAGLATPAALTRKISFIVLGVGAILALNIARLLTLLYAAAVSSSLMEVLHVYVWPVLLLFACLGFWYFWFEQRAAE